jgi:kynurenine---oxoglutarate transaminase / cysteine-S-conjugate beta-lyase / glutamine---phenylpyruvate transaminase
LYNAFFRGFEFELTRLNSPESYFKTIAVDLKKKRDFIAKILQDAGMNPVVPEGGYFIMADWSKLGEF